MIIVLPNILAMIGSLTTIIVLGILIPKIGGSIGLMLRLLIVGIFFAVFLHAASELAAIYNLLSTQTLLLVMGTLLSLGSLFFIVAGIIGIKSLN